MRFTYSRTIRFQDTDAAGVVYFAQGLAICHEAYEQSLAEFGIAAQSFFRVGEYIVPITHAEIDFFQPMVCGDRILVHLRTQIIHESTFAVEYQIQGSDTGDRSFAKALTRHVCLTTEPKQKVPVPALLKAWLQTYAES